MTDILVFANNQLRLATLVDAGAGHIKVQLIPAGRTQPIHMTLTKAPRAQVVAKAKPNIACRAIASDIGIAIDCRKPAHS